MQSGSILDRHPHAGDSARVRDLLVLWQHPETREIIPIGRFCRDGATYVFAYTRAAASIVDFRPLPGLADLFQRYESGSLPPVFGQRVMDRDRPDFDGYARALGLDPVDATPWEQIVRSGGRRAGDTLQFMPLPRVSDGRATARFLVNGIRHISHEARNVNGRTIHMTQDEQERALRSLKPGSTVLIEPEVDNPQDADACLVTVESVPVGWVPRALSASVRELMTGDALSATAVRVGGPGTPPHIRLVLDLDVPTPAGFAFDRDNRWAPLTAPQ
jgi:hypothetical protein